MNSKENWALEIDPNVRKDLARLPKKDAQTITDMIDGLVFNPFLGDLKNFELRNSPKLRYVWHAKHTQQSLGLRKSRY